MECATRHLLQPCSLDLAFLTKLIWHERSGTPGSNFTKGRTRPTAASDIKPCCCAFLGLWNWKIRMANVNGKHAQERMPYFTWIWCVYSYTYEICCFFKHYYTQQNEYLINEQCINVLWLMCIISMRFCEQWALCSGQITWNRLQYCNPV